MSESELGKALTAVQAALPEIKKDQTAKVQPKNSAAYTYKYVDLASISRVVLPLLAKNGLSWMTLPTVDPQGRFMLEYELLHTSGESRKGTYPLPDASSRAQEIGSALTYARRYSLCCVVGVAPDEDDDGQLAQHAKPQVAKRAQVETRSVVGQVAELNELAKEQLRNWWKDALPAGTQAGTVPVNLLPDVEAKIAALGASVDTETGEIIEYSDNDAGRPFENAEP